MLALVHLLHELVEVGTPHKQRHPMLLLLLVVVVWSAGRLFCCHRGWQRAAEEVCKHRFAGADGTPEVGTLRLMHRLCRRSTLHVAVLVLGRHCRGDWTTICCSNSCQERLLQQLQRLSRRCLRAVRQQTPFINKPACR
jgi:hypothetical protein